VSILVEEQRHSIDKKTNKHSQYAGDVGAEKRSKGRGGLVHYEAERQGSLTQTSDNSQYAGEVGAEKRSKGRGSLVRK